jgi:glutamate synthase domain-containing protein 2
LVRAVDWLEEKGKRARFSVVATGGLRSPDRFLKALAIGADAVYIGSAAVFAVIRAQMADLQKLPAQLALYQGKDKGKLDVNKAATSLSNFLISCKEEMALACQAMGKMSFRELSRADLVTIDRDLAQFMGVRYAASRRQKPVGTSV